MNPGTVTVVSNVTVDGEVGAATSNIKNTIHGLISYLGNTSQGKKITANYFSTPVITKPCIKYRWATKNNSTGKAKPIITAD